MDGRSSHDDGWGSTCMDTVKAAFFLIVGGGEHGNCQLSLGIFLRKLTQALTRTNNLRYLTIINPSQ